MSEKFPVGKVMAAAGVMCIAVVYFVLRSPPEVVVPPPSHEPAPVVERAQPAAASSPAALMSRPRTATPFMPAPTFEPRDSTLRSSHRRMVQPAFAESPGATPERPRTDDPNERALLDNARGSLRHEDLTAARVALDQHEREHPQGALNEEREALWVLLLEAEGDGAAAIKRAETFRDKWPNSSFSRSVENAVRRAGMKIR